MTTPQATRWRAATAFGTALLMLMTLVGSAASAAGKPPSAGVPAPSKGGYVPPSAGVPAPSKPGFTPPSAGVPAPARPGLRPPSAGVPAPSGPKVGVVIDPIRPRPHRPHGVHHRFWHHDVTVFAYPARPEDCLHGYRWTRAGYWVCRRGPIR